MYVPLNDLDRPLIDGDCAVDEDNTQFCWWRGEWIPIYTKNEGKKPVGELCVYLTLHEEDYYLRIKEYRDGNGY